jgi:hypothetical protein
MFSAARLLELGYTVLRPIGDNSRHDLVIERGDGKFQRVQCKSAFYADAKREVIKFPACSSACPTNGGKKSYRGQADFFAVYFAPLRKVYLLPVDEVGVTEIRLRLAPTRNGQRVGIRFATDCEL